MTKSDERDRLGLGVIQVPRAAEVLAGALRGKILGGDMEPGDPLPSERSLAEDSGLSRGSVRDALRILELEGLVATKPGRNGGTVVRRPDADPLLHTLEIFIRGRNIRHRALLEIRQIIEPECAALAAERATDEQLDNLVTLNTKMRERMDDEGLFLTLNIEWHTRIADCSHNELLSAFMSAISREIRDATDLENFNSPDVIAAAQKVHDSIIEALLARDPEAARRRMRRHVHAYREAAWDRVDDEANAE
jgi:GntR family transcriptional regulator, transcriptional repressor for pyruvate dehydrogenase complex